MKRRPSSSCAAFLTGSISCIWAEARRHETVRLCAASCRFTPASRSGASSGTFVRSMLVRMPRSSTARNPCPAAKSRIWDHVHAGQPSVENPSGSRASRPSIGVYRAATTAAEACRNSRRVIIAFHILSLRYAPPLPLDHLRAPVRGHHHQLHGPPGPEHPRAHLAARARLVRVAVRVGGLLVHGGVRIRLSDRGMVARPRGCAPRLCPGGRGVGARGGPPCAPPHPPGPPSRAPAFPPPPRSPH